MADIYVYRSDCDDFSNFGLVGALTPTSCVFEEEANGMSEITMKHPIDDWGRYTQLVTNNILMVEVPVRTTPEINDEGGIVTSVEQWTVNGNAKSSLRTLYKNSNSTKKIKVIPGGTAVTVVNKSDEGLFKVKCQYGTGWIDPASLINEIKQDIDDNSKSIESVQPAWTVKPQLFRIYSVEKSIDNISVMARHISYDLLYNLTDYKNTGEVTCRDALKNIMGKCVAPHEFKAYTNLLTVRAGVDWTRTNPIDALLNPETGLTALYGASLVRDNWELYVLHDPGLNRGVTVEYGKNMTGIKYTESFENVVTRIIPVGETKDDQELLLPEQYVDDPNEVEDAEGNKVKIKDIYPIIYTQELKCEKCKVGTDVDNVNAAYEEMRRQAKAVFENGSDLPSVEMSVDFINLGDTEEFKQYKNLERLFLWDYVLVRHKLLDIDVTSRIVSIQWDCLLDRMNSMEIGSVGKTLANSGITKWQIPTGFSGSKIASGTVSGGALKESIISTRHLQAGSINSDAIQANAITAIKLAANSIEAGHLAANAVDAQALKAITAELQKVESTTVTTDELSAALAKIFKLHSEVGSFDLADITNLLANALVLKEGTAGSMYITNLAVTSANILNATLGELVIKGEDGNYYRIVVGSNGIVKTEMVTVSDQEIEAGVTADGKQLVASTANIDSLNAQHISAASAIISTIVTDALNAGKITAAQATLASATIPELYTTAVNALGNSMTFAANEVIRFILGNQNEMARWFTFDADKGLIIRKPEVLDESGNVVSPKSIWSTVTDEKGYHVRSDQMVEPAGSFEGEGLTTPSVKIGEIRCKRTSSGGWVWADA